MMLKIPAIDLIDGECVRLLQGDYGRKITYAPDPTEQALRFQEAGFERLHVIDLEGAKLGTGRNREAIFRILRSCRIPVQVGGGIRTEEDVRQLLEAGAAYLILGTAAVKDPDRVGEWVAHWGSRRFILSLDLRRGRVQVEGWTEESAAQVDQLLSWVRACGIPQLVCTDVEKDGTLEQPAYTTLGRLVVQAGPSLEVLAAGGVSSPEHISRLHAEGVSGAVIGRALYEGRFTWEEFLRAG